MVGGAYEALFGLRTTISYTSTLRTCKKVSANCLKFKLFAKHLNSFFFFFLNEDKQSVHGVGKSRTRTEQIRTHTHTQACTGFPSRARVRASLKRARADARSPAPRGACSSGPGSARRARGWRDTRCKSPACPRFRPERCCPASRPSHTLRFKQKWAALASLLQMNSSALSSPFQTSKT